MPSDVRVGCSGWQYQSWRDVLYPRGCPQRRWLARYAEVFDTVEVNATFYRLARPASVQSWVEATPPDFVFAVKGSRYLTHMKRLTDLGQGLERFYESIAPLVRSPKMGPVLWQLPATFARDDERLAAALEALAESPAARHAFEFRHPSWFTSEVYGLLHAHNAALVIGDHPERPWQPRDVVTADFSYVRFHYGHRGRRGNYSPAEIAEWADRLCDLSAQTEVFAYFNNDWEGFAVRNGQELMRRMGIARTGQRSGMANDDQQKDKTTEAQSLRDTAKRTSPPANADTDREAVDKGVEQLERAGGGR
jgi:uncharacterized protein YecE (DUF72 family)